MLFCCQNAAFCKGFGVESEASIPQAAHTGAIMSIEMMGTKRYIEFGEQDTLHNGKASAPDIRQRHSMEMI